MIAGDHHLHFTPSLELLSFQRDNIKSDVNYNWSVTCCKSHVLGHFFISSKNTTFWTGTYGNARSPDRVPLCQWTRKEIWKLKWQNRQGYFVCVSEAENNDKKHDKILKYFCLYYSNTRENPENITQKIKHSSDREVSQLILMPFLPAHGI